MNNGNERGVERPNSAGPWLWREAGRKDAVELLLTEDGGEVASAMAVEHFGHAWESTTIEAIKPTIDWLKHTTLAENQAILKKAAVLLKDKNVSFEIAGHADNVGNEANNVKLSEQRAKAVRDFLVKQEVPADLITAKGYGSSVPVASNDTETGRLKNRRIEYRLTK